MFVALKTFFGLRCDRQCVWKMKIVPIPVLKDNYAYLIIDDKTKDAYAVDPAEAKKVLDKAKDLNVRIRKILTTHHHWDHASGNNKLVTLLGGGIDVLGGDDRIEGLTRKVTEGSTDSLGDLRVKVRFTPCHTTGHVLYFVTNEKKKNSSKDDNEQPAALFSGDMLFSAGCGRFFEGTPEQMHYALNDVIAKQMPGSTLVYCGHEYTLANLKFAITVDPENNALKVRYCWLSTYLSLSATTDVLCYCYYYILLLIVRLFVCAGKASLG